MRKHLFFFIVVLFLTPGCGKPKDDLPNAHSARTEEENQIVELAYNPKYLYPNEFYQDSSAYYENTVSVKSLPERKNAWIELSTNEKNQALAWSDSSSEYSSVHSIIVSAGETEKYFEFTRQTTANPIYIFRSRIHKASYFLPLLDKLKKPDTVGVYEGQLTANKTKEFVEYLWSCGSLGIYNSKVIDSKTTEYSSYFQHYIKSFIVVYGDYGLKDSIFVYDNDFKLDKNSRILTFTSKQVDAFEGN